MKYMRTATLIALAFAMLPLSAFAQVYYYAPGTVSGAYNYDSYIPAAAMPYVNMGYQMQQQYQGYSAPSYQTYNSYPSYSSGSQYQSQSQYQYQTSYPTSGYSYGYNSMPTVSGYYSSEPQSTSYPTGTYGPFGTPLCYWSDYPTYAPCGNDPQQWIQDPYTGQWY
jgi:hypothetical protein